VSGWKIRLQDHCHASELGYSDVDRAAVGRVASHI
jgi:hypothetical protein